MAAKFYGNGNIKKTFVHSRPNFITLSHQAKRVKLNGNHSNGNAMKEQNLDTAALETLRKNLPIYNGRQEILKQIHKHDTLIVIGETGCGKTTQIPQYIYEDELNGKGVIGITQPRRVAATTLSARVAQEAKTTVGDLVGYCIRFEDVTSEHTRIKFLTDGMLLREAVIDENLMKYTVIILDEAHERTVHTDVLFGIVKKAQATRKKEQLKLLKIVVMSATMDVDHFSEYFDNAPVIYLEGREHDVQIMYASERQDDYLFSCLVMLFQIHKEAPPNEDVLIFLTGQEEIDSMVQSIRSVGKELGERYPSLKVYSLYAALQPAQLQAVFKPAPSGSRKVIVSTNVAETSVTIPGIKYVIDSGKVKVKVHQPGSGLDSLKVENTSQAQAWQRAGRAGRERSGICYRMYTKAEFDGMSEHTTPELLRSNLATVALQLLSLKIDLKTFDFIDRPSKEVRLETAKLQAWMAISCALRELKLLGAIDNEESPNLTALGYKMSRFPIDPRYSKILLSSRDHGCGDDVLSIVALLSVESIFVIPPSKRVEAKEAHQKFVSSAGDHVTLLQVYRNFKKVSSPTQWCSENFLHARNLQYASNVRNQLASICRGVNLDVKSCGQDFDKVRRCLVTGLFMNVAELQRDKQYFTVGTRQKVSPHPSSVLAGTLPSHLLFTELVHTSKSYIRNLSLVDGDWLTELAPDYFRQHRLSLISSSQLSSTTTKMSVFIAFKKLQE